MRSLFQGYGALFREIAFLPNDGSYLRLPASLPVLVIICGAIGTVRNLVSVAFGIPRFYSLDLNIVYTMFIWPWHLFVLPGALLHATLHLLRCRNVRIDQVFGLTFHLQALHLAVPFFDWVGWRLNVPWGYVLGHGFYYTDWQTNKGYGIEGFINNGWYMNMLIMSLGIVLAWLVAGYTVPKVLRQRLRLGWTPIVIALAVTWTAILIPAYFIWPAFNTLLERGLSFVASLLPFIHAPHRTMWGYGSYFGLTALLATWYLVGQRRRERAVLAS